MLTEKQQRYVDAIVETGGVNHTECARIAGYGGTEGNLRKHAYDLLKNPKVLEAIVEHTKLNIAEVMPGIAKNLIKIALNPENLSSAKVGLQMLAMFGISPVTKTESKKTVEHTTNLGALEELKLLAAQLRGLPAPKMIDATPEEEEWSAHGD
jgi:phage terminase small subunit